MKEVITFPVLLFQFLTMSAVLFHNRKSATHILISVFIFLLFCWTIINYFSLNINATEEKLWWVRAVMAVTVPLPPVFFFVAQVFPNYELQVSKKNAVLLTVTLLFFIYISKTEMMFRRYTFIDGKAQLEAGPAAFLYGAYFFFFSAAAVHMLSKKAHSGRGKTKVQAQYILLGLLCTVIGGFSTNYILVVLFGNLDSVVWGPVFSLFLVFSLYYVTLKHRFLDIKGVLRNTVNYVFLSSVVLFSSTLFYLHVIPQLILSSHLQLSLFLQIMFPFCVVLCIPVLQRISIFLVEHIFLLKKFDVQNALIRMSDVMNQEIDLKRLLVNGADELQLLLNTQKVEIILPNDLKSMYPELQNLSAHNKVIVREELRDEAQLLFLERKEISVAVLLEFGGTIMGCMLLGEKRNREAYLWEELHFLEMIKQQLSLAIKNAVSYEHIKAFNQNLNQKITKATNKLTRSNQKLLELDQLKDEFIALVSHQLRTPLTVVKNTLWFSLNDPNTQLPVQVKNYIQKASTATERVIALVKDTLTISKIEGKNFLLHKTVFVLDEVVQEIIAEIHSLAEENELTLSFQSQKKGEVFLYADRSKIREAIQNILDNALKFTPKNGRVKIVLKLPKDKVQLQISDTGVGISRKDISKLFHKFSKIDSSYVQAAHTGTGLGLYISKKIILAHRGRITVESKSGKGSTFTIRLPRHSLRELQKRNREEI